MKIERREDGSPRIILEMEPNFAMDFILTILTSLLLIIGIAPGMIYRFITGKWWWWLNPEYAPFGLYWGGSK